MITRFLLIFCFLVFVGLFSVAVYCQWLPNPIHMIIDVSPQPEEVPEIDVDEVEIYNTGGTLMAVPRVLPKDGGYYIWIKEYGNKSLTKFYIGDWASWQPSQIHLSKNQDCLHDALCSDAEVIYYKHADRNWVKSLNIIRSY